MMRHHFLFGAGASAFSGGCDPKPPPLGNKLFADLKGTLRCKDHIPIEIQTLFQQDFEAGMDALWQARPGLIQSFLQDMAKYFLQFKPHSSNYYVQFLRIMLRKPVAVNIATLNYDMLIEHSIEMLGLCYQHPIELRKKATLPVFKLHGSCNIVPDVNITGMTLVVPPSAEPGVVVGGIGGARVKSLSISDMHHFLHDQQTAVPLLAMYHKDKPVRDCPDVITQMQAMWAATLNNSEKLFVIGTRLVTHDTHIWDPIANFKGELCWVSPDVTEARAWALEHDLKFVEYATTIKEFLVRYESEPSESAHL